MKRSIVVVMSFCVFVAGGVALADPITPVELIGGPGEQWGGWRNDTHIAYAQWANRKTQAYVREVATGNDVKLNIAGTRAEPGGFDPLDPTQVIYHQWENGDDADLYWYDVGSGHRRRVGGLNSRQWDWSARVSSRFILFFRDRYVGGKWYAYVMLYNREKGGLRPIERYPWSGTELIVNGSVGDRYASWTHCDPDTCSVYLYDHQRESWTIKRLRNGDGAMQYAPAIDEVNGVLYYVRSNSGCGKNVIIRSLPIDALAMDPTTVSSLPLGTDTGWTSALANDTAGGVVDLNFERWDCSTRQGDLYQVPAVGTLT